MASGYTAVVPAWNCERTIGGALAALNRLKPAPRRVIVVDDGSTDGTRRRAAAEAGGEPELVIISNERSGAGGTGPAVARNVGARGVATDWILFVDSDCYIDATGFERAWTVLGERSELDGLMGVGDACGPEDSLAGIYRNFRIHHDLAARNPPAHLNSSCFLVRTAAFQSVGGFNEAFGRMPAEDHEFGFRLVEKGYRLECDSAFRFFHDKPLSLIRFAGEARQRATASSLNAAGKLGTPPTKYREHGRWGAELLAANAAWLSIPVSLIAGWPSAATVSPVLALMVLAGLDARMLSAGCRSFGLRFAAAVVLLRWVELLAASVGIVCALPGLMRPARACRPA